MMQAELVVPDGKRCLGLQVGFGLEDADHSRWAKPHGFCDFQSLQFNFQIPWEGILMYSCQWFVASFLVGEWILREFET